MAKQPVWQKHHITYDPEWIEPVTKAEHWILTQAQRHAQLTDGFVRSMSYLLASKPRRPTPDPLPAKKRKKAKPRTK